jgi:hypothetical protein
VKHVRGVAARQAVIAAGEAAKEGTRAVVASHSADALLFAAGKGLDTLILLPT